MQLIQLALTSTVWVATVHSAAAWVGTVVPPRSFSSGPLSLSKSARQRTTAQYASPQDLYTPARDSMVGQTVVITGATSGLGLESAKRLSTAGANLILTGRTDSKAQAAVQAVTQHLKEMQRSYPDQTIRYKVLDLDDLSSVRRAIAEDWTDVSTIHVLLNNAGIMALPTCEFTVDGCERQMQSNHLGHFLLTGLLSTRLSDTARIVTVSSTAHALAGSRGLQWDYFWQPTESNYGAWKSYAQSKLANLLFTQELQRQSRAAGKNWTAVTLHPGVVATDLARYMMGTESYEQSQSGTTPWWTRLVLQGVTLFLKTPAQGATTQIWLAAQATSAMGGQYFVDCQAQELPWFATDPYAADRLWHESVNRTGAVYAWAPVTTSTTMTV